MASLAEQFKAKLGIGAPADMLRHTYERAVGEADAAWEAFESALEGGFIQLALEEHSAWREAHQAKLRAFSRMKEASQ